MEEKERPLFRYILFLIYRQAVTCAVHLLQLTTFCFPRSIHCHSPNHMNEQIFSLVNTSKPQKYHDHSLWILPFCLFYFCCNVPFQSVHPWAQIFMEPRIRSTNSKIVLLFFVKTNFKNIHIFNIICALHNIPPSHGKHGCKRCRIQTTKKMHLIRPSTKVQQMCFDECEKHMYIPGWSYHP